MNTSPLFSNKFYINILLCFHIQRTSTCALGMKYIFVLSYFIHIKSTFKKHFFVLCISLPAIDLMF